MYLYVPHSDTSDPPSQRPCRLHVKLNIDGGADVCEFHITYYYILLVYYYILSYFLLLQSNMRHPFLNGPGGVFVPNDFEIGEVK